MKNLFKIFGITALFLCFDILVAVMIFLSMRYIFCWDFEIARQVGSVALACMIPVNMAMIMLWREN